MSVFTEGNRYIFSAELLKRTDSEVEWLRDKGWATFIDGKEVTIIDETDGRIECFGVHPDWCYELVPEGKEVPESKSELPVFRQGKMYVFDRDLFKQEVIKYFGDLEDPDVQESLREGGWVNKAHGCKVEIKTDTLGWVRPEGSTLPLSVVPEFCVEYSKEDL